MEKILVELLGKLLVDFWTKISRTGRNFSRKSSKELLQALLEVHQEELLQKLLEMIVRTSGDILGVILWYIRIVWEIPERSLSVFFSKEFLEKFLALLMRPEKFLEVLFRKPLEIFLEELLKKILQDFPKKLLEELLLEFLKMFWRMFKYAWQSFWRNSWNKSWRKLLRNSWENACKSSWCNS